MMDFLPMLGLGLLFGLRHAIDADHIAAVSTIVTQTGSVKKSSLAGIFWGLGHAGALLLAGIPLLLFRTAIPAGLAVFFELMVGMLLIALGADVLFRLRSEKIHFHQHMHNGSGHWHFHSHSRTASHSHAHRSFFVGTFHGLAGSAGLALVTLAAFSSFFQGILYIAVFGLGSILGMLAVSTIIALPLGLFPGFIRLARILRFSAGAFSMAFGAFIVAEFFSQARL